MDKQPDIVTVIVRFLNTSSALELSRTCTRLWKWILDEGSGFWTNAIIEEGLTPFVLPSKYTPKGRFLQYANSLAEWETKNIVTKAHVRFPPGFRMLRQIGDESALSWQSPGGLSDDKNHVDPCYIIYNVKLHTYNKYYVPIPEQFEHEVWKCWNWKLPLCGIGSSTRLLIFDCTDITSPQYLKTATYTHTRQWSIIRNYIHSVMIGQDIVEEKEVEEEKRKGKGKNKNKGRHGEDDDSENNNEDDSGVEGDGENDIGSTLFPRERKEYRSWGPTQTKEEEEAGIFRFTTGPEKIFTEKHFGTYFCGHRGFKYVGNSYYSFRESESSPPIYYGGPHVNCITPFAFDGTCALLPDHSVEDANYNFTMREWRTGKVVRDAIAFQSIPSYIEVEWGREYFHTLSTLYWLQPKFGSDVVWLHGLGVEDDVKGVEGDVVGDVKGGVVGDVKGGVEGDVVGEVKGDVKEEEMTGLVVVEVNDKMSLGLLDWV